MRETDNRQVINCPHASYLPGQQTKCGWLHRLQPLTSCDWLSYAVGDIWPQKFQVNLFSAPSSVILMLILQKASSQSLPATNLKLAPFIVIYSRSTGLFSLLFEWAPRPNPLNCGRWVLSATTIPSTYLTSSLPVLRAHLTLCSSESRLLLGFKFPHIFCLFLLGHDDLLPVPWIH